MRLALLLVFVAYPLLELAVLIRVGQSIGVMATIAIVLATAALGMVTASRQGFTIVTRARETVASGRAPIQPVAEGALVFFAGALLILPGLIGDALGLLLLIPPVRSAVAAWSIGKATSAGASRVRVFVGRRRQETPQNPERQARPEKPGPIIEGEYTRLDDSDDARRPRK